MLFCLSLPSFSSLPFSLGGAGESSPAPVKSEAILPVSNIALHIFKNPVENGKNISKTAQEHTLQKGVVPAPPGIEKPQNTGQEVRSPKLQRDETAKKEKNSDGVGTAVLVIRIFKGQPGAELNNKQNLLQNGIKAAEGPFKPKIENGHKKEAVITPKSKLEQTILVKGVPSRDKRMERAEKLKEPLLSTLKVKAQQVKASRKTATSDKSSMKLLSRVVRGGSPATNVQARQKGAESLKRTDGGGNQRNDKIHVQLRLGLARANSRLNLKMSAVEGKRAEIAAVPNTPANAQLQAAKKAVTSGDLKKVKDKDKVSFALKKSLKRPPVQDGEMTVKKSLEQKNVSQNPRGGAGAIGGVEVQRLSMLLTFPFMHVDNGKQKRSPQPKKGHEMLRCKLSDLLFVLLTALFAGAQTVDDVMRFLEQRKKWMAAVLGIEVAALPSRKMIWSMLFCLDAESFYDYTELLLDEIRGKPSSFRSKKLKKPLLPHLYVWETPSGVIIGQHIKDGDSVGSDVAELLAGMLSCTNLELMASGFQVHAGIKQCIQKRGGQLMVEVDEKSFPPTKEEVVYENCTQNQRTTLTVLAQAGDKSLHWLLAEHETAAKDIRTHRYLSCGFDEPQKAFFDLFPIQLSLAKNVHWMVQVVPKPEGLKVAAKNGRENWHLLKLYAEKLIDDNFQGCSRLEVMKKCREDKEFVLTMFSMATL